MVKQVTGVAADTSSVNLDNFNDITVKTMEVQSADISSLNISEDIIVGGRLEAANADFKLLKAGFIQFDDNIISLTADATTDELIIKAPKILLQGASSVLDNIASITTEELQIKDSVVTIGLLNTIPTSNRGIHFKYIISGEYKDGFFGYCPDDDATKTGIFKMLTGVTLEENQVKEFTLGNLELQELYVHTIGNNTADSNDTTLNIKADSVINMTSGTDTNIISTAGNINIKCTDWPRS